MAATTVTSAIPNSPVLDQYNYEDWSFRIKLYLLAEDLWDVVEATTETPKREDDEAKFKAWRKKDAKALIVIQNYCGSANYSLIWGTEIAKAAWDTLAETLNPAQGPEGDANDLYMPFFQTLLDNDWDAAMEYVRQHPEKLNATFEQFDNGTALHFVVSNGRFEIAKKLVQLMSEEDLEILDSIGRTALHLALLHRGDSHEIVKCMVEKNKKLLSIRFNNDEIAIPFVLATIEGRVAMSQYLCSASPLETLEDLAYAGVVMSACVVKSRFDILLDLVQRHPKAAFTENKSKVSPFSLLAGMHVPPTPTINTEKEPTIDAFNDARTNAQKLEGDQANQRHLICLICTRVGEYCTSCTS